MSWRRAAARDCRVRPGFALYFGVDARPNSAMIAVWIDLDRAANRHARWKYGILIEI